MQACITRSGSTLVRLKRQDEALAELARAAELEPDRARYAYVYAIGARFERAAAPTRSRRSRTISRGIRRTATRCRRSISFNRDAGETSPARSNTPSSLRKTDPNNAELKSLIETLRREAAKPAP